MTYTTKTRPYNGKYYGSEFNEQSENHNANNGEFEHVIRYEDGIKPDFVLASCSVPVNYDYTKLNVEDHTLPSKGSFPYSNVNKRYFWDGGLLANTPLRQTMIAHRDYWYRGRKMEDNLPSLSIAIINLHPRKQEYVPYDYDGVVDGKNDITYHDRTEFDEYVAVLLSDFQKLASSLIKLAKDNGVSEKSLQMILQKGTKTVNLNTGQHSRYNDLLKARVDVDFVIRLERKNDSHTISNKVFDFSKTTIKQLVYDGYEETKPQLKMVLSNNKIYYACNKASDYNFGLICDSRSCHLILVKSLM